MVKLALSRASDPLAGISEKEVAALLALQRAKDIKEAYEDFDTFAELVCKDDETGEPIRQAKIHRSWTKLAEKYPRLLIWAHRYAGKTVQLSILRTVWKLGRDPSLRFLILSATQETAKDIVAAIAAYIEDPTVQEIFPGLLKDPKGSWSAMRLDIIGKRDKKNSSVRACGVGTALRGARCDELVIDDILLPENVATVEQRRKVSTWVKSEAFGSLSKRARVLIVGNAMHPDDVLHEIAKKQGWRSYKFPILDKKTGQSTWADAWPISRIDQTRIDMGPAEFVKNMLCKARSDEDARFKQEWIDEALRKGNKLTLLDGLEDPPEGCTVWTGVDLAVSKKKKSDKTAFFTFLEDRNGNRTLLNLQVGKFTGPQIVDTIIDLNRRFGSMVAVENNACFTPETRVLTIGGYKEIRNIEIGDFVWTHKGRWRQVKEKIRGKADTLVTVKARGCLPVRSTPNHWFWMREAGRTPGRGGGHYRPVGEASWISYGFRDRAAYTAVASPRWAPSEEVLTLCATNSEEAESVVVDENLALALGLYLAEGHATRGQVFWTFGYDEQHLSKFVSDQARTLTHNSITIRNNKSTERVVVSSTRLANLLHLGTGANKKPEISWLGWPLCLRLALVRGWLMGDGSIGNGSGGVQFFRGATVSRDLAMFVQASLMEAGIVSSLSVSDRKIDTIEGRVVNRQPIYQVLLSRDSSVRLGETMNTPTEIHHWKILRSFNFEPVVKHRSPEPIVLDGEHAWSKVPEVGEFLAEAYGGEVFNLVVEEDESYTVENYIVHNAQDFILQFARDTSNVPVLPHTTSKKKKDPILGVEGLAIELANGKWIIPNFKGTIDKEVSLWIEEMLYYSPKAHTGDRLMACYFARELARRILGVKQGSSEVAITILGSDEEHPKGEDIDEPSDLDRLFDVPETEADKAEAFMDRAVSAIRARIAALKDKPIEPELIDDDEAEEPQQLTG